MKKAIVAATGLLLALTGCSSATEASGVSNSVTETTITVFAASSLTETFTELGRQFEAANPGTKVTFSFAASSTLAEQIIAGAPADVFASASKKSMEAAAEQIPVSTIFTSNRVVVSFPVDKPLIAVTDLNDPAIKWVQCDRQVPCGTAADAALEADGITGTPVSLEPDVKSVVGKLTALEVDAAIIYSTDVKSAGSKFSALEFSNIEKATTKYPIGINSNANTKAQAFVDFVLSEAGQQILLDAGFGSPS
jgi:molybdate transport system substrate-binding protein